MAPVNRRGLVPPETEASGLKNRPSSRTMRGHDARRGEFFKNQASDLTKSGSSAEFVGYFACECRIFASMTAPVDCAGDDGSGEKTSLWTPVSGRRVASRLPVTSPSARKLVGFYAMEGCMHVLVDFRAIAMVRMRRLRVEGKRPLRPRFAAGGFRSGLRGPRSMYCQARRRRIRRTAQPSSASTMSRGVHGAKAIAASDRFCIVETNASVELCHARRTRVVYSGASSGV